MKHGIKTFFIVLCIITLILALSSCKKTASLVKTADNEKMSAETRSEIDKLTRAFEEALVSADVTELTEYKDESFAATDEELAAFFRDRKNENKNPFVKYDEYYIEKIIVGEELMKIRKDEASKNYIELYPRNSEIYVALYASDNDKISSMATLVTAKVEDKWRIMWIDISDYKYNGENAERLHESAKKFLSDGKLLPAYLYAEMMYNVIQPGKIMKYPNFDEMQETYNSINEELYDDLELPLTLDAVPDVKIFVIGLSNQPEEGIIPLITYQTKKPIADETARTAEAKQIIDELDKKFAGLKDEFHMIALNATNDDPTTAGENIKIEQIVLPTK